MQLKNTPDKYGLIAQAFHWLIGLTIIAMIPFGWWMEGLEANPEKYKFYGLHKSIGVVVLALVILRFFWRRMNETVENLKTHKPWEKILSKTVHIALYVLMLAMPLSGWLMSSAGGHPVSIFGLFTVPPLVNKDPALGKILNSAHSLIAWGVIAIMSLHVLGALKHHFLDKDKTLRRMLPILPLFFFL